MANTIENLNWRYATKKYDTSKKLSDEQRHLMLEALRLTPSSFGLQPWKFIHVSDAATREKLKAAAWNQAAVTDASDLIVLAAYKKIDEAHVDAYLADLSKTRQIPVENLKGYRDMMVGSIKAREAILTEWNTRQTYIALGIALATAAENHIDSTPMEGFDPAQFDQILGLSELGLTSTVVLALGFRAADDETQNAAKSRFPLEQIVLKK